MNIEIGGGSKPRRCKYTQVDVVEAKGTTDYVTEAWNLHFAADNSVDEIFGRHILEHLSYPEAREATEEWLRVLKLNGKVTMIVPDMEYHAKQLALPGMSEFVPDKTNFEHAMAAFFGWPGKHMEHRWGYALNTLQLLFKFEGFSSVVVTKPRSCDLQVVATKTVEKNK